MTTTLEYKLSFTTPAFLGNADQQAQWRTPPIKALLRQWWRIVHAPKVGYDHQRLRADEGDLFGFAGDEGAKRSQVQLRLSSWELGKLKNWPTGGGKVKHPEVTFPVASELYLGYGPLEYDKDKKGTKLGTSKSSSVQRTGVDAGKSSSLSLRLPDRDTSEVEQAVRLLAWFGTMGSRSRNGWGSLRIEAVGQAPPIPQLTAKALGGFLRPLSDTLKLDWPNAIGMSEDRRPLVWLTRNGKTWGDVMSDLTQIKIAFRTHFKFMTGGPGAQIEERHILAYPVTNHDPKEWGSGKRLGNQIRFKIVPNGTSVQGLIFHLPCRTPDELPLPPDIRSRQMDVWRQVHKVLDGMSDQLSRLD